MTMRTSVVAVFTCDSDGHLPTDTKTSSFSGATEAGAALLAISVWWKHGITTVYGQPVQVWHCPRCARREQA